MDNYTSNPQPASISASNAVRTLSSVTPILDAFNHRHRNQHSHSHWWSTFRILRRAVRLLLSDLTSQHGSNSFISHPRKPASSTGDCAVPTQARWLDTHVLPRAYLGFTQLAADNQHAPLGILLLTILALINSVVSDLVPYKRIIPLTIAETTKDKESVLNGILINEGDEPDRGISISRRPLPSMGKDDQRVASNFCPTKSALGKPMAEAAKDTPNKDASRGKSEQQQRKRKKRKGDELSSLFGSLS